MKTAALLLTGAVGAFAVAGPTPLVGQDYDSCAVSRTAELDVPTDGIRLLDVIARAGSLEIEGRSGAREIQVEATVCASDAERMQGLEVTLDRSGSTVNLETVFPDHDRNWSNGYARIHLVVAVPAGMDLRIEDGSGHTEVQGVGSVEIDDGSGHLTLRDISGDVEIDDGSGHVEIFDVVGHVEIDDGSGGITVSGVQGGVRLTDGSGPVEVDNVSMNVVVTDKGSGPVVVRDIDGDLSVSGTRRERIRYDNIGGALDLPAPRRRGRGN